MAQVEGEARRKFISFVVLLFKFYTPECLNVVTGTSNNLLKLLMSFFILLVNQQLTFPY